MESVSKRELDSVADQLHIPQSKQGEFQQQYPVVAQQKRAYSVYYLTNNPAPSWRIIATALYNKKELVALEVVQKVYLKGEPCADSCRSEGRIGSLCIMYLQCTIDKSLFWCLCMYTVISNSKARLCILITHRFMSVHVCGLV